MTDTDANDIQYEPLSNDIFDKKIHVISNQIEQKDNSLHINNNKRGLAYSASSFSSMPPSTVGEGEEFSNVSLDDVEDEEELINRASKRKTSVQLGRQALSEILDNNNVSSAISILQQAMEHLNMTQEDSVDPDEISHIYSDILKSLCDPQISTIVKEMSKSKDSIESDIQNSIMWRLFFKVVESGYVLEANAYLAVVDTLVEEGHIPLALQAIYWLPRKNWDTRCYHAAVLLHLLHDPIQSQEAERLVYDYGRPYLEVTNPIAPDDLPPIQVHMPLMADITDKQKEDLYAFYRETLEANNPRWKSIRLKYEKTRDENLTNLKDQKEGIADWAFHQLKIETNKEHLDRISTTNDNYMIQVANKYNQYMYGWYVYESMKDAVNEQTPYAIMHMCWTAFENTPSSSVTSRVEWEKRAFSVYSRFMCSEYLHPEQKEVPDFLHDILSIISQSPEILVNKQTRYVKAMSVYQLLLRFRLDKPLCDERVLVPILCAFLSSCKDDTDDNPQKLCHKAIEIWQRKLNILDNRMKYMTQEKEITLTSNSMIWGLLILCLRSGSIDSFNQVIEYLFLNRSNDVLPSSMLAPIQIFHDFYLCSECYFQDYIFDLMEYTDEKNKKATSPVFMDPYGFLHKEDGTSLLTTNINEPQAEAIGRAVFMGVSKQEELVPKQIYYSSKKAKALIRHCFKLK